MAGRLSPHEKLHIPGERRSFYLKEATVGTLFRQVARVGGIGAITALLLAGATSVARAQDENATRVATREKVRQALGEIGPRIGVSFRQNDRNPFNFSGSLTSGLDNAGRMEIIVLIGTNDIMAIQIYPHVGDDDGYINVDQAADGTGLMRQLLAYNDGHLFYWGMDDASDIFAAFTITLESGFPTEVVDIVLRSVPLLDKTVGEMSQFIGN